MNYNDVVNNALSDLAGDAYTHNDFFEIWDDGAREFFKGNIEKIAVAWIMHLAKKHKESFIKQLIPQLLRVYILFDDSERFWKWFENHFEGHRNYGYGYVKSVVKQSINDYRKPKLTLIHGRSV